MNPLGPAVNRLWNLEQRFIGMPNNSSTTIDSVEIVKKEVEAFGPILIQECEQMSYTQELQEIYLERFFKLSMGVDEVWKKLMAKKCANQKSEEKASCPIDSIEDFMSTDSIFILSPEEHMKSLNINIKHPDLQVGHVLRLFQKAHRHLEPLENLALCLNGDQSIVYENSMPFKYTAVGDKTWKLKVKLLK